MASPLDLEGLRLATARRLAESGCEPEAVKLFSCGLPLSLRCGCCGRPHEVPRSCRRRFCPVCQRVAAAERTALYAPLVAAMHRPVFATFTIQHHAEDSTADVFHQLLAGWKRFKALKWFRECVRGGVGAVEVSAPSEDDDWEGSGTWNGAHPHIHALLDTPWLDVRGIKPGPRTSPAAFKARAKAAQIAVREQWRLACRADDAGLFLRVAKKNTVEEVLKYALKPGALLDSRIDIRALLEAMNGRKLVVPWGRVRKALKIVRAEMEAAKPPMVCECGEESWEIDPAAARVEARVGGVWSTPARKADGSFAGFVKFTPHEKNESLRPTTPPGRFAKSQ